MNGQKSLTRTQSSIQRASNTVRTPIHTISIASETTPDRDNQEEPKLHARPNGSSSTSLAPVVAVLLLSLYTLYAFFNWDEIPTSENLLLVLILVAVLLFVVWRTKGLLLLDKNPIFKHVSDGLLKRLSLSCCVTPKKCSEPPVQWFIGESSLDKIRRLEEDNDESVLCSTTPKEEGVEFYSNGDYYEGEFHKGKCNGSGVYNYAVNGRYEGDWIDGRYDGYGVETWAKGSRYRGQYRQGLRHGYGVYKFYTGDTYGGEWCNGQSHGLGVQTCGDGSCYVGEFKCGMKHGLGCYHFRNGDRYAGEYFGDKVQGFGVYHFSNGHCYEGSWHEGRKQGYGMYTFRNGESRCGEWDNGILKTSLSRLTDTVLRAVEAARKAARDAVQIRPVDDKVNKAVMAANKAATAARVAAVKAVQNRIRGKFCDDNNV